MRLPTLNIGSLQRRCVRKGMPAQMVETTGTMKKVCHNRGRCSRGQLAFQRACEDAVDGEQVAAELGRVGLHRQSVQLYDL